MGGSMGALNRLDRIQVRAVRIIGHTEGIKLDSLAHRRGVAALCVMHRLVKKRAPSPLHSLIPMEAKTRRSAAHLRIQPAFNCASKRTQGEILATQLCPFAHQHVEYFGET